MFLGFHINTWTMTVTWPFNKWQCLHQQITDILSKYHKGGFIPCCALAQVLGLLHNGCYVLPLSVTTSLQLQHAFNDCIKKAMKNCPSIHQQRIFWESSTIQLSTCIGEELHQVAMLLNIHNPPSTTWQCPIGLLILWESQFTFLSDTSHEGIGGWCPQFGIMWQVTKEELHTLGYSMVLLTEPSDLDPLDAIHINVLEFVALTVNIWFALVLMCRHDDPALHTQHVGNLLASNTTSISWMAHTGRTKSPHSCHLAQFLQTLLTFSPVSFHFQSHHISGKSNDTADLLSQPSHAESWASIINKQPMDLHCCKPYLMLHSLLSTLHNCIASTGICQTPS